LPVDSQLSDRCPNRSQLQIATTPIREHGRLFGHRIVPLAMGTTTSSLKFSTTEYRQFPRYISILHTVEITVSNQTGPLVSGICVL
jgi:hypothetical protein